MAINFQPSAFSLFPFIVLDGVNYFRVNDRELVRVISENSDFPSQTSKGSNALLLPAN